MDRIKRLLVTSLVTVLIAANISAIAYASDTDAAGQPFQDNLSSEDNTDLQASEDTTSSEGPAVSGDTTSSGDSADSGVSGQESTDSNDGVAIPGEPSLTDEVPEGYEIYIDEQGQVYYKEIEPEEVIIEETVSDSTEEPAESEVLAIEPVEPAYSEEDLRLLACLVYAEAGNQSYNGMLAVANVVLNRAKSDVYYHVNTIKEVIYDKKWSVQFSVTIKSSKTGLSLIDRALKSYDTGKFSGSNPEAEKKAMDKATKAARAALKGKNNIGDYLCFRVNNKYASGIKNKYFDYKIIGDHIFYRTK